jgi:hypothetical protein
MKEKKTSDKGEAATQADPFTQTPTIRDAVTYIVDEQGNEIKQPIESSQQKAESTEK